MKYNELTVEFNDIVEEQKKLNLLPSTIEYEVNNYLWSEAGEILEKEVYKRMPRSKYQHYSKGAPKFHAKDTESLEIIRYSLGVKVQTKLSPKSKDFGYLIFPDEGRGIRQRKKGSQEFFVKALDNKADKVIDGLTDHLNKKIEEEL